MRAEVKRRWVGGMQLRLCTPLGPPGFCRKAADRGAVRSAAVPRHFPHLFGADPVDTR